MRIINCRAPAARHVKLLLAAIVLAVEVGGCDKHQTATSPTPPNPQVTPVLAPIDARIAFESTRDGSSFLYVANGDGSQVRRLAAGRDPAWSPDGRQVAFGRSGQIYVIDSDGSGERSVTSGTDPSWSPDGTRMVIHREGFGSGLFTVEVNGGGGATKLIDDGFASPGQGLPSCVCSPTWSPDGQTIAFTRTNFEDPVELHIINADGSNPRAVFNGAIVGIRAMRQPAWSTDGLSLVVEDFAGIGVARADGSGYSLFMAGPFYSPDWAPRGLVYVKRGGSGGLRIFVADQPGSEHQLIPDAGNGTYNDDHPAWVRR